MPLVPWVCFQLNRLAELVGESNIKQREVHGIVPCQDCSSSFFLYEKFLQDKDIKTHKNTVCSNDIFQLHLRSVVFPPVRVLSLASSTRRRKRWKSLALALQRSLGRGVRRAAGVRRSRRKIDPGHWGVVQRV